jgi:RNA polymerase sigma-70 factor, ECF subfamily
MCNASASEITAYLLAWTQGDRDALDRLMPVVNEELRRIARARMMGERAAHTLNPTALVNEAYIRLIDIHRVEWQDRVHFFAVCSQIMRRILVDYARSRGYRKRGGGAQRVTIEEPIAAGSGSGPGTEVLDLDDALTALSKFDGRKAQIAQLRFFGGLNVEETAAVLGVSAETVHRDWKISKAWLARRIGGSRNGANR